MLALPSRQSCRSSSVDTPSCSTSLLSERTLAVLVRSEEAMGSCEISSFCSQFRPASCPKYALPLSFCVISSESDVCRLTLRYSSWHSGPGSVEFIARSAWKEERRGRVVSPISAYFSVPWYPSRLTSNISTLSRSKLMDQEDSNRGRRQAI
jgi:hypothetical protein